MSFTSLYRISFYAMLVAATLVLSGDASDVPYALAFPIAVGAAGALAFLTVDRGRGVALAGLPLNFLAIASFPLAAAEYFAAEANILLLALGHWLVYLQLILMFRPKSVAEDWELFLLGVVQVLVGAVVSQNDTVGIMLFLWAVLALWVLGLFSLKRDAVRARGSRRAPAVPGSGVAEDYPGLLNVPFLLSALRVTATTMTLGGVIFLAMPRRPGMASNRGLDATSHHQTGFDDEVQLGQLGEILENDTVVMTVELFDERGEPITPEGEPLWRGVTMARYDKGRWFRQGKRSVAFPTFAPFDPLQGGDPSRPQGEIRQVIKLESNDSVVLFGLRPMLFATGPRRNHPDLSAVDGTITRPDPRPGTYDYEVRSSRDADRPQPGEKPIDPEIKRRYLLAVPDSARDRIRAIAEHVIETTLPPDRRDDRSRAIALMLYLRQSGAFSYTLKLEIADPSLDPVEDFLVNRKSGHCEYFASALAMLVRSVGIPARLVNGFKGGDWNDLAQILYVRQKHAHSWVEVCLADDPSGDQPPVWMTLDPTPGNARDESVAKVGGFRGNFRQVTDLIRYVWVFYIVGYNADRQSRLIYQPIRELIREARRGFGIMADEFRNDSSRLLRLFHFESTRSFISVRGFVVSFIGLLLLVAAARVLTWVVARAARWLRGQGEDSTAFSAGAAHYRRLAVLLSGCGLERPPAETQNEFARRATVFLTARGSNTEAVADVPRLVVDAFYRVRFGHLDLTSASLSHLEARLDALEANLKASESRDA